MALRMLLVAMVVATSLPIPNADHFQRLLQNLRQEFSATANSIRNEWPEIELHSTALTRPTQTVPTDQQPAPFVPVAPTTSEMREAATASAEPVVVTSLEKDLQAIPKQVESPLELAFSVIVEEYAREAASNQLVEEVKANLATLPMPEIYQPLPPAPEASELVAHQETLARIEANSVNRVASNDLGVWEESTLALIDDSTGNEVSEYVTAPIALVTTIDLGPWATIVSGDQISKPEEQAVIAPPKTAKATPDRLPTPVPGHWLEIADISSVETTSHVAVISKPEPVVVSRALKLTVEAIAAWTQVVVRPY